MGIAFVQAIIVDWPLASQALSPPGIFSMDQGGGKRRPVIVSK